MIIHLVASMRKFNEDYPNLKTIAKIIYENQHIIARNWFDAAFGRTNAHLNENSLNWPAIIQENIKDIKKSDAIIIEGSRFNFSQGFQVAIGLQYNKPILNLCRVDSPELDWPDRLYVSGISNELFTSKFYKDQEDLKQTVEEFLKKCAEQKQKITIEIEEMALSHLESLSKKHDMSKSEILRELIFQNKEKP